MLRILRTTRATVTRSSPGSQSRRAKGKDGGYDLGLRFRNSLCETLPSGDYRAVRSEIDESGKTPKHNLRSTRKPGGIQQRLNVVLDESSTVSGLTTTSSQRILERRQRTDPAAVLYENTPHRGGNVKERDPRPSDHEQPAEDDKNHEREMNRKYEIGQRAVDQA
jgi:hypothetical protein